MEAIFGVGISCCLPVFVQVLHTARHPAAGKPADWRGSKEDAGWGPRRSRRPWRRSTRGRWGSAHRTGARPRQGRPTRWPRRPTSAIETRLSPRPAEQMAVRFSRSLSDGPWACYHDAISNLVSISIVLIPEYLESRCNSKSCFLHFFLFQMINVIVWGWAHWPLRI